MHGMRSQEVMDHNAINKDAARGGALRERGSPPNEVNRTRRSSLGLVGRDRANTDVTSCFALDQLQAVLTEQQTNKEHALGAKSTDDAKEHQVETINPDSVRSAPASRHPAASPARLVQFTLLPFRYSNCRNRWRST